MTLCRRLSGGGLLATAMSGILLSLAGAPEVSVRVFASAPAVALLVAVSVCRDWRLALPAR